MSTIKADEIDLLCEFKLCYANMLFSREVWSSYILLLFIQAMPELFIQRNNSRKKVCMSSILTLVVDG